MKNTLQKIIDNGLLATIIVFPLSVNTALISPKDPGHPLLAINFSLADVLIGIILLLWVIKIIIHKMWRQIKLPPVPILIFIGIGALSFVNTFSITQWLKELIQMIEYFFLFYLLLINNMQAIKPSTIKNILFVSTSCIVVLAFVQYTILKADPYFVKGLFENRNILGTFLCIAVPLIYMELIMSDSISKKIWMGMLLLIICQILVSGSAMISILISLLVISGIYRKKSFIVFLIVTAFLAVTYPFITSQKNLNEIKKFASVYEQGSISENYYRRLTLLGDVDKSILLRKEVGNNYLLITIAKLTSVRLPEFEKGERYKDMEDKRHIKNRYLEMQASLNLISENTLLGIGLGNYQNHIGTYFNELPKVNTAEPNQNNIYLLVASTTGILGLIALLWILLQSLNFSLSGYKKSRNKEDTALFLGLSGSIIAIMIEGLFSYIFVNSLLVPLVFILYLSRLNTDYHDNN